MTVQEVIEIIEEIAYLGVVYIHRDGCFEIYEGEEIDSIPSEILSLSVKRYDYSDSDWKKFKKLAVEIEC